MRRRFALAAVLGLAAACGGSGGGGSGGDGGGSPPETPPPGPPTPPSPPAPPPRSPAEQRPPNAVGQQPAFPNQTRAPRPPTDSVFRVEVVATGLQGPWSLAFLPSGRMLVSEKAGRMRVVSPGGVLGPAVAGLPAVYTGGQGGLLDVAPAPDFDRTRRVFWSYAEPRGGSTSALAVATAILNGEETALTEVRVIFRQEPAAESGLHFGSRIVFDREGRLFVTTGDRGLGSPAQDGGGHIGKVLRINADGSTPSDNPFVGRAGFRPEVWSVGHRNIQGAVLDSVNGRLWTAEHGPKGGDELNTPEAGRNYGWPVIGYGVNYDDTRIGEGVARDGMEQPVYYWDPVIAPAGMAFYTGDRFPDWRGSLFIGGLQQGGVTRLTFSGGRVATEERLDLGGRIRDVQQGPDGLLYVLDESAGRILRLTPP